MMETIRVNMTPCEDIKTIHASQNDNEAREWGFELHNNGEKIDSSSISDQLVFKAYEGGTEEILPTNGSTPTTSPFKGDIKYPQGLLSDQEFLYRESPTEEDGLAKITDIKGNTIVWNQLVQNGNFADKSNWIEANATFTVNNNVATMVASATYGNIEQILSVKANHMYFATCDIKLTTVTNFNLIQFRPYVGVSIPCVSTTEWQTLSGLFIPTTDATVYYPRITDARASGWDAIQIRNCMVIDLTQMGLGISSPSEFTSLFGKSYYDYCQGVMLSFGGRNVKFNQLVQNGNFADTSGWKVGQSSLASISASSNVLTYKISSIVTAAYNYRIQQQNDGNLSIPVGHKVLVSIDVNISKRLASDTGVLLQTGVGVLNRKVISFDDVTLNAWVHRQTIYTIDNANQYIALYIGNQNIAVDDEFKFRNFMLIDLTEMFGSGNEPSAEGLLEIFKSDYYAYTTGQYMNIGQPVSLKTVGKNLLNPSFTTIDAYINGSGVITGSSNDKSVIIPLLSNMSYVFTWNRRTSISPVTYEDTQVGLYNEYPSTGMRGVLAGNTSVSGNNIRFNSGSNKYAVIKIANITRTDFDSTIIASQLEIGSTATSYEPYIESTISIPLDEFPNGMDGINDARDEKNETGYVKRFARVTFDGTHTIESIATFGSYTRFTINHGQSNVKYPNAQQISNYLPYLVSFTNESTHFYMNVNQAVVVMLTSVVGSTRDSFNAYLSAHHLTILYELVTPLENYGVVDLGTLNWMAVPTGNTPYRMSTNGIANMVKKVSASSVIGNILCSKYPTNSADATYLRQTSIAVDRIGNIIVYDPNYNTSTSADAFKSAMSGVYLLYEKENPQGFTTASLVTENTEIPLSNEDGVLIGKCTEQLSSESGFFDAKIKLADADGECYSNKIQLHVERKPS